jgi:hypothetical protein
MGVARDYCEGEFEMRPENEARLKKIQAISGLLRAVCTAFLVLISVNGAVMFAYIFLVHGATMQSRVLGAVHFAVPWAGMLFCLYYLLRLLGNYSRGEIFTRDSAMQIRRWGLVCVLWGGLQFAQIYVPWAVWAHPAPIPASDRQSYEVEVKNHLVEWQRYGGGRVVNGLIIVAISWFMAVAAEMREENELTV